MCGYLAAGYSARTVSAVEVPRDQVVMLSCAISTELRFVSSPGSTEALLSTSTRILPSNFYLQALSNLKQQGKMANSALIPFLVTMMLVTGVCNTILNKYQVSSKKLRL